MKYIGSIFLNITIYGLLILLIISCVNEKTQYPKGAITNFSDLQKKFKKPTKEYGTIPFFVWNGDITRQDIDSFMVDFSDAGCGGVFIHARPGLITTYLSQEWFELFKYTVDKGKELGINVWIYDEFNFPSGFAGGHVPAEMPESYKQGQGIQMKKFKFFPVESDSSFFVLKEDNNGFTEIIDLKSEAGNTGNYYSFSKAYYYKGENDYYFHGNFYGGFTYVDVLYPGVAEKFIQTTMDGYEKYAGEDFGHFMPGIFTDEPHLNSPGGIRWTPDLFNVFQKRWGYDLQINLPSLYEEVGDWKKVRHNYAQTLLQLFIDRWAKPYFEYCEEKGLLLTGHYWEHTWPSIRLGPDNMAMYPWFQIPGIDALFNQFNEEATSAQFGNVRSVKELSSVANQLGLHRTLCETYGGAGWDLSFKDMKRLGDWEYVLGVNLMNQHMSPITIEGSRKYDHPPYFTYHEPWWKEYKHLNKYFARLSVALSAGKQKNDILVIEPTTSAWMYDSYHKSNKKTSVIGDSFQAFVTKLEKSQVEYDLGSENIIKDHGKIDDGQFIVGKCNYSRVIIPPLTENLDSPTFDLLKEYVLQGGKLLMYSIPYLLDGSSNIEMSDFFKMKSNNIIVRNDSNVRADSDYFENANVKFQYVTGGNLYHNRRSIEDGQILFLANSSIDDATEGEVIITGADAIQLNAFTGEMTNYPEENKEKNKISVSFSLPPAGSLLLYISESKTKGISEFTIPKNLIPVPAASLLMVLRQTDNILMMDFCDVIIEGQISKDLQVLNASHQAYKQHGLLESENPTTTVRYKELPCDTFSAETGFTSIYRFQIEDHFDFSGISAVVERPDLWDVHINGIEVHKIPGKWFLDYNFGVFDIGEMVKPGENELSLKVSPMNFLAEIEPAYIIGNFSVVPADKGWAIKAPATTYTSGSWDNQGMPMYPWGMSYTKTFDIQKLAEYYELELGKWNGTVSKITINDKPAGIIAFPPYTIDVSGFINKGSNTIQVSVIGSLKNLLGPFHNNPSKGMAISPFWRGVTSYPPGEKYQIIKYGLMDDFYLYQGKQVN